MKQIEPLYISLLAVDQFLDLDNKFQIIVSPESQRQRETTGLKIWTRGFTRGLPSVGSVVS